MGALRTITLLVALLALASMPLDAQRRRRGRWYVEAIPHWAIEGTGRLSILKDDPVMLYGARVGRQLDSTVNLGLTVSMLWTESAETQLENGFERITSLVYAGPSLELRDSLRGPIQFIARASAIAGLAGYEQELDGVRTDGSALIVGVESELGILLRATRALQFTATVGGLYGWRPDGGAAVYSVPIATAGIRFVR